MLFIVWPIICWSQNDVDRIEIDSCSATHDADTITFHSPIENYYDNDVSFLNQAYLYDKMNEAAKLKMYSRNVYLAGVLVSIGMLGVNGYLVTKYNWSLWIDIPCATALAMGTMGLFVYWGVTLEKKAELIDVKTAYLMHIRDNVELGIASYSSISHKYDAIALGMKLTF